MVIEHGWMGQHRLVYSMQFPNTWFDSPAANTTPNRAYKLSCSPSWLLNGDMDFTRVTFPTSSGGNMFFIHTTRMNMNTGLCCSSISLFINWPRSFSSKIRKLGGNGEDNVITTMMMEKCHKYVRSSLHILNPKLNAPRTKVLLKSQFPL